MEVKSGSIRLTEWLKTLKRTWQKLNPYSIISWNIKGRVHVVFFLNSFMGLKKYNYRKGSKSNFIISKKSIIGSGKSLYSILSCDF